MDQAPTGVTRVINQIVEHTVETVVPSTQGAAAASVTEKTVIVKDDDLAAQSIGKTQKAIIRITTVGGKDLVARGVITDSKGTALTDRAALDSSGATSFEAILSSGERVSLVVQKQAASSTSPFATLSLAVGTSTGFAPAPLADISKLRLGQSVIRVGGVGSDTVGSGVIASLPKNEGGSQTEVEASVGSVTPGSILITIFGEIIGITTTDANSSGSDFYTIPKIHTVPEATPATSTSVQS